MSSDSMISLDKVDGELILKSNGRYFEWIKGFQKAAASKGLLGIHIILKLVSMRGTAVKR